jgi:succinate dehydrogenase/fumarate reductase flavoprotein subunit
MAFLKNLGEKLGTAAGNAADKARQLAEISKLNSAIGTAEKSITDTYLEMGKQLFEQEKDNLTSVYGEHVGKILKAQDTIEELRQKIAELKAEDKPEE